MAHQSTWAHIRGFAEACGIGVCYNLRFRGIAAAKAYTRHYMAENSKRKWILWLLAAALGVTVIAIVALRGPAPLIEVVTVTREDLTSTITSNGKVEPISPDIARAQFPTFVAEVKAAEGQMVRRGQVILTLDASDIRSQLAQARADLLAAQTDLKNAHTGGPPDEVAQLQGSLQNAKTQVANLERTQQALQELQSKQAATQEEVAQNQAALATARANLQTLQEKTAALTQRASVTAQSATLRAQQAKDQVAGFEDKLHSATVMAHTDGTLYSLPVAKGDFVRVGDALAQMADLRHVRVRAFVDEPDLGSLAPNQAVQVKWDALPNRVWTGKIEQVPKQVVARGSRSVGEVLCSIDNDKIELLPNVNVEVRILVNEQHHALVIPRGAVRYDNGQHFVFVYGGDEVHRRDIKVGAASQQKYEVVSGLKEGDRVALPGEADLTEGMKVRTVEAK